jgi:hypothetical protein
MLGTRLFKAKQKAKKVFRVYNGFYSIANIKRSHFYEWFPYNFSKERLQHELGFYRKTKVPCSCYMCGHQRRYNGPSIQEVKELARAKDSLNELVPVEEDSSQLEERLFYDSDEEEWDCYYDLEIGEEFSKLDTMLNDII